MSLTYLVRTEPRGTSSTLEAGLAARLGDPLWMLGRQWQLGELLGEDAGSPVGADLDAETAAISRFRRSGQTSGVAYDPAELPLDVMMADRLRTATGWTARLRIDTGRAFVGALRDAGVIRCAPAFREAYQLAPATDALRGTQPDGARLLDVAAGRVPDGEQLYHDLRPALRSGAPLPLPVGVDPADADKVLTAAQAWSEQCDATLAETGESTWIPERLLHEFSVATGNGAGDVVLDADGTRGDRLEWHDFDARPSPATGFTKLPRNETIPTGVRFRGMPNARWWEFEDQSVDLGAVDAGPSDIGRLALLEFGLVYGNDFFAIPLQLPVGTITRITSLVVADTFSMRLAIEPAAQRAHPQGARRWTMFTLSRRGPAQPADDAVADFLFLPPVAGQLITSEEVEDVLLLRDEMADMAWAVEQRYEGETGRASQAIEEMALAAPETRTPSTDAILRYVLGTTVPPYWFPLVPLRDSDGVRLALDQMANRDASVVPRGRFLDLAAPPIPDADVPREGTRLVRDYALTRSMSGATLAWARRVRHVGSGEGSSGLRFDATELEEPSG